MGKNWRLEDAKEYLENRKILYELESECVQKEDLELLEWLFKKVEYLEGRRS